MTRAPETSRRGDWLQTYTGLAAYPLDLAPSEISIVDIAHSLSMQCRYAGHCMRFYSVAEHSWLVSEMLRQRVTSPMVQFWGLMHDAPEAYLLDMVRPLKESIPEYKVAEAAVMKTIADVFGLAGEQPEIVGEFDHRILNDERDQNMQPGRRLWNMLDDRPLGIRLGFWTPEVAEARFLHRFDQLRHQLGLRPMIEK